MAVSLKIVSQVVASGIPGPAGKSAYQIAVDNGFVGTESEWLKELNPFKGWFDSVSELEEEHSAPSVGEYAYVKGATSSDPVKIYECSTEGSWSDSGRTVDTSAVQTFRSGEAVDDVGIDGEPTAGSDNLVKSKGVEKEVNTINTKIGGDLYFDYYTASFYEVVKEGIYLYKDTTYEISVKNNTTISVGIIGILFTAQESQSTSPNILYTTLTPSTTSRVLTLSTTTSGLYKVWSRSMDGAPSANIQVSIKSDYSPIKTREDLDDIIPDIFQELDSKRLELDYRAIKTEHVGINADNGTEISSSFNGITDFIPVEEGSTISTYVCITTSTAKNGLIFYDAQKNVIDGSGYYAETTAGRTVTLTVPQNASFVKISVNLTDKSKFYFRTTYSLYRPGDITRISDSVKNIYNKGIDFLDIDQPVSININAVQMTGETEWFRSDMVEVRKGMTIKYNILSRSGLRLIKLYSTNIYNDQYVIDTVYASSQQQLYSGTYVVPNDGYVIVFHLTSSDYTGEQNATLCNFATKVLSDTVSRGIANKRMFDPIDSFKINLGDNNSNVKVLLSTHDSEATKYDNIYMAYASLLTVDRNMFYLYYEANGRYPRQDSDYTIYSGLLFAYSTDGEHFTRGFPQGMNPYTQGNPLYDTNVLMEETSSEYEGYHDVIKSYPDGIDIVKVQDSEFPFRMVGNITLTGVPDSGTERERISTTMHIWKSVDGIRWTEIDEVSSKWYDSQYSVIPKGDVLKIYCRLRYKVSDGENSSYPRTIGVMYTDLYGNIITPATILFGDGLYTSAACKLDDKRDILFPTWYGGYDRNTKKDICSYKSYIVNYDDSVFETSTEEIEKLQLKYDDPNIEDDNWGTINPGMLLIDGDQYLTYLQMNVNAHYDDVVPSDTPPNYKDAKIEIRRVPINFNYTGIKLDDL